MDESLDSWFAREILSHEQALVRYLLRTWKNRDEVHDLRQEIYVRVYEAGARSRPSSPKSFLFTTARNLMADRVRRNRVVSIEAVGDLESLHVPVDSISPEQRANAHQELRHLARAFDALPPKCREVVWMRRVEDVPQKEVASRLGISEKTVEKHVLKGVRLLADFLFGATADTGTDSAAANTRRELPTGAIDEHEYEHGQRTD